MKKIHTLCLFIILCTFAPPIFAVNLNNQEFLDTYNPNNIYEIKPILLIPTIELHTPTTVSNPYDYHVDYTMNQDGNEYECSYKYGCSLASNITVAQAYKNKQYELIGFVPWLRRSVVKAFRSASRKIAQIQIPTFSCNRITKLFGCIVSQTPHTQNDLQRQHLYPRRSDPHYPYNRIGLYLDSTRDTFADINEIKLPSNFRLVPGANGWLNKTNGNALSAAMRDALRFSPEWSQDNIQCVTFVAMVYNAYGINMQGRLGDGGAINMRTDIFNVHRIENSTIPPKVGDLMDSKGHVSLVSKVNKTINKSGQEVYVVNCIQGNTPASTCRYAFITQDDGKFKIENSFHNGANLPFAWMTKKNDSEIKHHKS